MRLWLGSNPLHHPLFAPVLLVAVILAVYYPAVYSGIHPIDDPGILSLYSSSPPLSQILLPGSSYYYRPLVELSFWLDNLLWGMEPRAMHLESILLHCANSLLVFVLARKLSDAGNNDGLLPLLAGLLFALHPVHVEAVAWIAGRTDLLLALFVLSSCCFLLRWLEVPRWQDLAAALVLFGTALLSKETALAFGAVSVVLVTTYPATATVRQRICAVGLLALPLLGIMLYALVLQRGTSGLSRFLTGGNVQLWHGVQEACSAFGFYAKKLLLPVPLNFAINEAHPVYGLVGVGLVPVLWWTMRRFRLAGVFFLATALVLMPAVLIAVKQVSWTLFAERYLYLPTAFFVLGLSVCAQKLAGTHRKVVVCATCGLLAVFAGSSLQRTMLWKDKPAFFEDAVKKSPGFGSVYYSMGGLLFQNGKIDQAADAFATADRLNQRDSMRYVIKAGIMATKLAQDDYHGARSYFFEVFPQKKHATADFLELLFKADNRRISSLTGTEKTILAEDLLETLALLYQKRPDPFWLYQSGQSALLAGDTSRAAVFFKQAYMAAPPDAHYRGAAETQFLRLEDLK